MNSAGKHHDPNGRVHWPASESERRQGIPFIRVALAWIVIAVSFVVSNQLPAGVFDGHSEAVATSLGAVAWSIALAVAIYLLRGVAHVPPRSIAVSVVLMIAAGIGAMYVNAPLAIDGATRAMAGVLTGALMALLVDQLFFLLPAALLAAVVDIWSVYAESGVTRHLYASEPAVSSAVASSTEVGSTVATQVPDHVFHLADVIAIPVPLLGAAEPVFLGFVDIAFATCFVVMACSFRARSGWTAAAVAFGIPCTMGIAAVAGGIPALPMIGVLAIIANARLLLRDRKYVTRRLLRQSE